MKKHLKEDFIKRVFLTKISIYKIILKSIFRNKKFPKHFRVYIFFLMNNFLKNSLKVRTENRCLLTARGQGVFSFFGLSRIVIRKEGSSRNIPGLRKDSW